MAEGIIHMATPRQTLHTLATLWVLVLAAASPFPAAVAEGFDARADEAISPTQFEAEASKNHENVAKYYEDSAAQMRAKAQEHKLLLEQYEDKSYLYGKKAQDLQGHAVALIRKYEQAAEADVKKAGMHRQIAARLKESSPESRLSAINPFRR
jgi:hypothetical protein